MVERSPPLLACLHPRSGSRGAPEDQFLWQSESVIIHINGWPGVGKLTVARIVAEKLGARLVDNHVILNPALAIVEHNSASFTEITQEIRKLLRQHMAQAPRDEVFVLTDAFEEGSEVCEDIFNRVVELAEHRGVPLLSVSLDCTPEENARRLTAEGHGEGRKLTDVDVLMGFRKNLRLLRPDVSHRLDLDTTDLTPEAAAEEILRAARALVAG